MFQSNPDFRFRLFIYLASIELLLSGVITALLAGSQGLDATLMTSSLAALAGLFGMFISVLIRRMHDLEKRMMNLLMGRIGGLFPFTVILFLVTFFIIVAPGTNIALVLSPLLTCVWLIGLEFLLLFGPFQASKQSGATSLFVRNEKILGILSILLVYGFLLLPSHIPTWLDGFPWNSPPEFLFAAFILPFTFLIGWDIFAKRFFVFLFGILVVMKFIFLNILPQAGLGIYAFSSEEAATAHKWERSYYTFASPNYTQVINRSYYGLREFPVEGTNNRFGFDKNQFWLKLELSGYVNLQKGERLVLITQGAKQIEMGLLDISTQKTVPLQVVERIEDVDSKLFGSIPESRGVKIQGAVLFDIFGQIRLEPILLFSDGSTKSLFDSARVWTSLEGANYPTRQLNIFGFILNTLELLFAGLIFVGLFTKIRQLWVNGKISLVDLYLALSAMPLFFISILIHKQYANVLALVVILVLYFVKFIDLSLYKSRFSGKVFLITSGVVLLALFLAMDTNDLRVVTNFPPFQDGLEYQTFARNIYVNQDVFLENTPPRAYKVLFPYIVGFQHILFGHSAAAQLFFNTWYAVLSGVIIVELTKDLRLSAKASLSVAVYYLSILFLPSLYIFYFRFGLIEPLSTFLLLCTYYFAVKHQRIGMFLSGMFTVLLRLDYLGITFTAILLTSKPMLGTLKTAWFQFLGWLKINWKLYLVYMTALCLPVLFVIIGYFLFIPNYMLNAHDTDQTSLTSFFEGMLRVIIGGSMRDLREKFTEAPADVLLISAPLLIGFLLMLATVFLRAGIFKKLDLRLGLLTLSLLPAYIVVRPAAYFPRFSLPLLPLDLIIIGLFIQQRWLQSRSNGNDE